MERVAFWVYKAKEIFFLKICWKCSYFSAFGLIVVILIDYLDERKAITDEMVFKGVLFLQDNAPANKSEI